MMIDVETATALAVELRTAVPLVQVRLAGRIAQEMADPDVALVLGALADMAAQEVALPARHLAVPLIPDGPGWWSALLVAETVNYGLTSAGTILALLDQPASTVACVVVRLLSPAGLVRGVRL